MRKILLSIFVSALIFVPSVSAQTVTLPMPTSSLTPTPGPTVVNYELPYPGILPNSPLYIFKAFRDKISETLTTDPLKKSNFYLLQTDKNLSAALMLYKQGNIKMAENTLSKSQKYLEKSIDKMIEAKKSQESVNDIYAKIKNSSAKQKQEIKTLLENAKGDEAKTLQLALEKAEQLENRVYGFDQ